MERLARFRWPIVLTVIGAAMIGWGITSVYFAFSDPGVSMLVPGKTKFTITKTGNYTLWSEVSASFEGQLMTFPTGLPPGVTIKIIRITDGTVVPLQPHWPTERQDSGGAIRVVIGRVRFDNIGEYQISVEGLQEKRALHLDQFEFYKVFLPAFIGFGGPTLVVAGLAWGLLIILSSRKTRPNQAVPTTVPPPLP
jgi:hypothetical protein